MRITSMLQQETTFPNSATINANNFNVTAGDDFFNYNNATINVNNFNVFTIMVQQSMR